MSDRILRLVLAALAAPAVGIAGYLTWAHYADATVVCATGGCSAVEQSAYAAIFGVPVALVGLLGSSALLLSLVRGDGVGRAVTLALAVTGLLFAAYLVLVQLVVLDAVCEWCIANDTLLAVVAVLALWRARIDVGRTTPEGRGRAHGR